MKRRKIKTIRYAGINIREVRPGYFVTDFHAGAKRFRRGFSDLESAKVYADTKRLEIRNRGTDALLIDDVLRRDALEASKILQPTGARLVDAAREYARRHPATASESFRKTCERYIRDMKENNARPLSIEDKRVKLRRIASDLGETPTGGMDEVDLKAWAGTQGFTPGTARAYIGAAKSVLNFHAGRKINRISTDEKPPVTWSASRVRLLLRTAETEVPEAVAAMAILFFAGLRPYELTRLSWNNIDLDGGEIALTGGITKTRTARHVEIQGNLREWLLAYRGGGKVVKKPFRGLRERVMKAAGLMAWPPDVARHTFATMLYRHTDNAAAVMAALGHYGSAEMFVRHYKGTPTTKREAKEYWAIRPERKSNVIELQGVG